METLDSLTVRLDQLHGNVFSFWRQHETSFTAYWSGISSDQRRKLLLEESPTTPTTRTSGVTAGGEDVHGANIFCPEINLRDLSRTPDALLRLFSTWCTPSRGDHEDTDLQYVRARQDQFQMWRPGEVMYLVNRFEQPPTEERVPPGNERTVMQSPPVTSGMLVPQELWNAMMTKLRQSRKARNRGAKTPNEPTTNNMYKVKTDYSS